MANKQVAAMLFPEKRGLSGFDVIFSSITRSKPTAFQAVSFKQFWMRMGGWKNIGEERIRSTTSNITSMGYPLDSGNPNILWLGSRGLSVPVGDDRSIRRWVHGDCLLHKAVEEFSPAA